MYARAFLSFAVLFAAQLISLRAATGPGIKQKLGTIAVQKVKSRCPSCKVTVHCKWVSPTLLKKPSGDIKDLIFDEPGLPAGYVTAKVVFKNDHPKNNKVQLYVSVQRKLPVARSLIKRGETLNKEDVVWRWKNLSQLTKKPIASVKEITGKTAVHIIRKGQLFYPSDVAGSSVIQAGDHVTMLYNNGGLRININCIARETKKTGQKIRLYSNKTHRLYLARIVNKDKIIWKTTL